MLLIHATECQRRPPRGLLSLCSCLPSFHFIGSATMVWRFGKCFRILSVIASAVCFICLMRSSSHLNFPTLSNNTIQLESVCKPLGDTAVKSDIFFLETSGAQCLTTTQVCSVESAARANPRLRVLVLLNSRPPQRKSFTIRSKQMRNCLATRQLSSLSNVHIQKQDLLDYLKDTDLWPLVANGQLNQSQHLFAHLSDAIRVAVLWKHGGIYLDMDCIVFSPLHCLKNSVGMVDPSFGKYRIDWAENGVMSFDRGHSFLPYLMRKMATAFQPEDYIKMGPQMLTESIQQYCGISSFLNSSCNTEPSLRVEPFKSFYAITNRQEHLFYDADAPVEAMQRIFNQSYLAHVYGLSNKWNISPTSVFATLARTYCPNTYHGHLLKLLHFDRT